jgi:ELWxxDGT repeat protein
MLPSSRIFCQDSLHTFLVKDINTDSTASFYDNSSFPREINVVDGNLYFIASTSSHDKELWISGGRDENTRSVSDMVTDLPAGIGELKKWDDKLIFRANDGVHGSELWISDLNFANARMIKDLKPNNPNFPGSVDGSYPENFTIFNEKVFFSATTWSGLQLFVTDGTESGTIMLTETGTGNRFPQDFVEFNGKLFFSCQDRSNSKPQLWTTDGTPEGTMEFKSFGNSSTDYLFSFGDNYSIIYKDRLYFSAYIDSIGAELWVTDGTSEGTNLFMDIDQEDNWGSWPHGYTIYKSKLYFIANDFTHLDELWCTDGDTTYMVKDINPDGGGLGYSSLHVINQKLFFEATDEENGTAELWVSNGNADSTIKVLSNQGIAVKSPQYFVEWKNKMVFVAGEYDKQLWLTDGTQINTYAIYPDSIVRWAALGYCQALVNYKGDIYYTALYDDSVGVELYRLADTLILNTYSTISDTACFSYTSPSLRYTWIETGTYLDTIPNTVGQDSIITIELAIVSIKDSVEQSENTLIALENDAAYQWKHCGTDEIISGATTQSFAPTETGSYYVCITKGDCKTSSSCYSMLVTNQNETDMESSTSVYPNPVSKKLFIDFTRSFQKIDVSLKDLSGKVVFNGQYSSQKTLQIDFESYSRGLYFLYLKTDDDYTILKIIKE